MAMADRPGTQPQSSQSAGQRAGRLHVISAPSGAGKTSLVKALLKERPSLAVSVSHTTRTMRPTEVDGRDYHFVDNAQFDRLVAAGAFLEHARVFDNQYGTGREQVNAKRAAGHDVLLEIDWQGARQIRASAPDCVTTFILPPSRAALEKRLRSRGTDSDAVIARRLADAATDMSHCLEFDYAIVNDDFEQAVADLLGIIDCPAGARVAAQAANRLSLGALLRSLVA
jgi:guanylate kinase